MCARHLRCNNDKFICDTAKIIACELVYSVTVALGVLIVLFYFKFSIHEIFAWLYYNIKKSEPVIYANTCLT